VHKIDVGHHFEQVYQIVSHQRFLDRQGLGNEVPFFVDPYDPKDEFAVQDQIDALYRRLELQGLSTVRIPMYDTVLEMLKSDGRLEALFEYEKTASKGEGRRTFLSEMQKFCNPGNGKPLQREILRRMEEAPGHRLALMYQIGAVFPFLRTHTLLSNLHSVITEVPLVIFFPGDYVSSDEHGFYLSLFGKFNGDYYRAFNLMEYVKRGQIHADTP
jgi:hypothetical protein